jgi:type I restriction enzyme R subunit
MEQYEQFLADEPTRHDFYERLHAFGRCLRIALSSDKLPDVYSDAEVDRMKRDWKQFSELKRAVQLRFQEVVDLKEFEPKIQKLLDDHVVAMPAEVVVELVNINDPDALQAVVKEVGVSPASKADRIASATRRVIHEKMEEDPSFYKRFSELLEETIRDYRAKRLSEKDYLKKVVDLAARVAHKDRGQDVPEAIKGNEDGQAFYGVLDGVLVDSSGKPVDKGEIAQIALAIIEIIKEHHIVDVWKNDVAQNNMRNAVDDYFFDVLRDQKKISLPVELMDDIDDRVMNLARARFPG